MGKIESGFSVESLREGIRNSKNNIRIFEEAITKEKTTIEEYKRMIKIIEEKNRVLVVSQSG